MLFRKLLRTARRYKAQFISMIIMIAIGVGVFLGFNIEWYSIQKNTDDFFAETKYADYRLTDASGFTREDVESVLRIDGVDAATRFFSVNADVAGGDSRLALMVTEDATVSAMLVTAGREYDKTARGVWLSDKFAEKGGFAVGDTLTLTYGNIEIEAEIFGLCKSGEMMVCVADKNQLMPDLAKFGFAYATPALMENALGDVLYPQMHLLSDMEKGMLESAVAKALGRTTMVVPKGDHTVYAAAQSEATEGKAMAAILPVLFLAIGILTMVTTMHRISASEKVQIGTLKALGFRDRKILAHYTSYGAAIGLVGALLGVLLGYGIAAAVLSPNGMMGTYFDLPEWKLYMPGFCVPVIVLTVAFLALISCLSVKKMLRGSAAETLRPYAPKTMKGSLIERTRLWEKLPFGAKWNMRDILRHRARSAMTLLGVVGCMLLLVGGVGMKDTMDGFMALLDRTCPYAAKLRLSDTATNADATALAASLGGDWSAQTGVSCNGRTVALEVYDNANELVRFIDADDNEIELSDDGACLCLRLADVAKPGDEIEFSPYGSEQTYKVKVAGYHRSVLAENIVMSASCAEKFGVPYRIDTVYTAEDTSNIPASDLIAEKQDKSAVMDTYDTFNELLDAMVLVLVLGAVILGVVVLYNLGVMSYIERSRELATLKVLGFRDRKIGSLLVSQNVWLTVVGVLVGLPAGVGVLQALIAALATEYELKLYLGVLTYAVSISVTFGVSLVVGRMVARKSRRIDMVEALKNGE